MPAPKNAGGPFEDRYVIDHEYRIRLSSILSYIYYSHVTGSSNAFPNVVPTKTNVEASMERILHVNSQRNAVDLGAHLACSNTGVAHSSQFSFESQNEVGPNRH